MPYNDDLFKESTMTFGEHLEELRSALIKALLGLAVGFLVGLCIGGEVVKFIQTPVQNALKKYYAAAGQLLMQGDYIGEQYFFNRKDLEAYAKQGVKPTSQPTIPSPNPQTPDAQAPDVKPAETSPPRNELKAEDLIAIWVYHRSAEDRRFDAGTLNPQEAFGIYVMAALISGAVFASPIIFYQIWNFVAAGLYPHEKKYVHLFLPVSLGLFLLGVILAFFFVFEPVLDFLFSFNKWMNLKPDVRISEWMSFVLMLPIGFGIAFQLPLVMLFLERIHVANLTMYIEKWRIAILAIFVISMVLTPADPYSMLLMAVPLCFLYYFGIALCKYLPRSRSPYEDEVPAAVK